MGIVYKENTKNILIVHEKEQINTIFICSFLFIILYCKTYNISGRSEHFGERKSSNQSRKMQGM